MARYQRLEITPFGERLLTTGDLDPVYILLWKAQLPRRQLARWLWTYWLYYHVGVASYLSEIPDSKFWDTLVHSVHGTVHPRGAERRHFRDPEATHISRELRERRLSPSALLIRLFGRLGSRKSLEGVLGALEPIRGFGPWVGFKITDMFERLDLYKVQVNPTDVFSMYKTPRKGAELLCNHYTNPKNRGHSFNPYQWSYQHLLDALGQHSAPPRYERTINILEIETILCKWKSHQGGHYPLGKDTRECRQALLRYSKCRTSQRLLKAGKKGGLW